MEHSLGYLLQQILNAVQLASFYLPLALAFAIMQAEGIPVIFDVTHSLQLPGGGEVTGGARRFAEPLARAAVAAGADGIFLEVHPDPPNAKSDATTQLPPDRAHRLLASLLKVRQALRGAD